MPENEGAQKLGRPLLPRRSTPLCPTAGLRVLARGKTWSHWPCVISSLIPDDPKHVQVQFMDDGKHAVVDITDCLDFNTYEIERVLHYASTRPKLRRKVPKLRRAVDIATGEDLCKKKDKDKDKNKERNTCEKRTRATMAEVYEHTQIQGNDVRRTRARVKENEITEVHSVQDKSDCVDVNDDGSETFATTSATDAVDQNDPTIQEVSTVLYSFPVKKRRKPLSWMAEFLK